VYLYVLSSCYDVRYDFRMETMFGLSLPPVVCRRAHMSFFYVICVCLILFGYSGVQRILCCVLALFFIVSCTL